MKPLSLHEFSLVLDVLMYETVKFTWSFTRFQCFNVWNHEFSHVSDVLMYETVKFTWIFTRFGCLNVSNH